MVLKVKCPTCGRLTEYSSENPWRPFCSERCKIIDLGAWAEEAYTIEGKPLETDDDIDITEDSLSTGKIPDKSLLNEK